jgi:glycine/D-amino acid oxidase-like deaminating enzyme
VRVAVIGSGIVGAACALALVEGGAEVIVIDRVGVAGETSSRCEGNLLVSDKAPGAEADLAVASNAMWRVLAARLDAERPPSQPATEFEAKGGVVVAFGGGEAALERFAEAQRATGIRAEAMDAAALASAEPFLSREVVHAVHYPDDAQIQPSTATQALLDTAIRSGARLVIGEVTGPLGRAGRLSGVMTTTGPIEADVVVNCAGPWAGEVAARLGARLDIRPRRGVILVTTPMPQRVFHKVYDSDYVGAVGSGDAAMQTSTVGESTPGGTVLIGSSR